MKIYVNFAKPRTAKEFLKKFYYNGNRLFLQANATYKDKACKNFQCSKGKFRSFDDLLMLIKTYYPSYNAKKLMHLLLTINYGYEEKFMPYFGTCSGMKRIRYIPHAQSSEDNKNIISYNAVIQNKQYASKYSWKDLFTMLNINNNEDLDKYYAKLRN